MALTEKEHIKQLTEDGNKLLSPPSSLTELIGCLDRVESLLMLVEQSPSEPMRKALSLSMKALIANELLRHSNIDVKVAVASCISEITRITAPDAPYEDDQMREVFQLIVSSFEKLDDTSSKSYLKRTSILETVAKVRSCVVMLDLECDALIAEMFQHFFRSIRSEHPEHVFSSMETIMTLVLEESEDVPVDLVSSILNVLKTENKEVLPIARQLGETVIDKCLTKIKPGLEQAMKSLHTTPDDYPKVVADVLKVGSDATETRYTDSASKNVADANDVANEPSEKAVEVAEEIPDDAPPSEELRPTAVGSPKSLVSNGTKQKETEDTSAGYDNAKEVNNEPHGEEAETGKTKVENSDAEESPKSRIKPQKVNKRKGKNTISLKIPLVTSEPPITDEKEGVEKSELHEKDKKDGNAQTESFVADAAEPAENEKEPVAPVHSPKTSDEPVDVPSPSPSGSIANENASKKVESEEKKDELVEDVIAGDLELKDSDVKKSDEEASVSEPKLPKRTVKKVLSVTNKKDSAPNSAGDLEMKDSDVKKSAEEASVSEPKLHKRTVKKVPSVTDKEDSAPNSADVSKKENETVSELDAKSSMQSGKKVQVGSQDRLKRGQGKETPAKAPAKSPSNVEGKKSGSSVKSPAKPANDESDTEKESKSNSKRNRSSEKKAPKFGKELVGSKVQVWWPEDKKFYAGVIEHFDPSTGKHKVTYNDGDVEVLKLEKENWKLVDGSVSHQGHSSDDESPDVIAETPKAKKAKTSSGVGAKQGKTEASAKKGGASSSKSNTTSKSRSKLKEVNKLGDKEKNATLKSTAKAEENKGGKSGNRTSKSGGKSKDNEVELSKGSNKPKQETPKVGSKSKVKSPKTGSKSNGNSKAKAAPSANEEEDEEDEEMESSPEPVKAPASSKGKSASKSSQKSATKRKRSTKG